MPEEKSKLTPLETRKHLLLLESDLNRAQLVEDLRGWKAEFQRTKEHWNKLGSVATIATRLTATVSTARRVISRFATSGKKSWFSFLFDGVTAGTSLWYMLRSERRKDEG